MPGFPQVAWKLVSFSVVTYIYLYNQSESWDSFIFVHEINSGCELQGFKHFCRPVSSASGAIVGWGCV